MLAGDASGDDPTGKIGDRDDRREYYVLSFYVLFRFSLLKWQKSKASFCWGEFERQDGVPFELLGFYHRKIAAKNPARISSVIVATQPG